VRNPNTRSAYRVAWRSFLAFCSARQLELESVKAYYVGSGLDQHPGSRLTQRQHLAAVRLLFDSLMMRGVVEYNPAARARPPRLVRESSHTPVFEEAEIVAFLDSISLESLKDVRDKAIFCVQLYSWCRVSALLITTNEAAFAGYGSKKNEGKKQTELTQHRIELGWDLSQQALGILVYDFQGTDSNRLQPAQQALDFAFFALDSPFMGELGA
jgi:site-specific recombinase XerD